MLLNRKSDPSSHSIQVPIWIPPSPPGRGMELTTSIRLRPANRRSSKALAVARDCGEPSGYSPGFTPESVAPSGFCAPLFAIRCAVLTVCRCCGYGIQSVNRICEFNGISAAFTQGPSVLVKFEIHKLD